MRKVLVYSALLLAGLTGSQILPILIGASYTSLAHVLNWATLFCLAFIMIHVGYEFTVDKSNLRAYGWDYVVAATAAASMEKSTPAEVGAAKRPASSALSQAPRPLAPDESSTNTK